MLKNLRYQRQQLVTRREVKRAGRTIVKIDRINVPAIPAGCAHEFVSVTEHTDEGAEDSIDADTGTRLIGNQSHAKPDFECMKVPNRAGHCGIPQFSDGFPHLGHQKNAANKPSSRPQ